MDRTILALITDGSGRISREFTMAAPEAWATEQMRHRYSQIAPRKGDSRTGTAALCFDYLVSEYKVMRTWFDSEGKLSPLLQSKTLSRVQPNKLGNGIGWDWRASGDLHTEMVQFKSTLIAAERAASIVRGQSNDGNAELLLSGVARMIRAAYQIRADAHVWRAADRKDETGKVYDGGTLAARWVAFQTFNSLRALGGSAEWSWNTSQCNTVFGPTDATG